MARNDSRYRRMVDSNSDFLKQSLLTGTAIVLPVLITVFVFLIVINLLANLLNPLVIPIQATIGSTSPLVPQMISIIILLGTIVAVGSVTESRVGGDRLKEGLDHTMARIPGISSIYRPIDQMSKMFLKGDAQNFKDVVLVEYPNENSYAMAFQTSNPPEMIETAVDDEEMLTVFLPMGPNPFMGGFILHLSKDEVYDLDLSVQEGISSIISFGVAVELEEHPPEVPIDIDGLEQGKLE